MIVIVCGMHRSGTSAMAGVLHHNGIVMGEEEHKDFYPPPMKENPKGFFENVRFRRVNDKMLAKYDYSVKSFNPVVPDVQWTDIDVRFQMRSLLDHYTASYNDWGWKDPRTNLTLPVWLFMLEQMRMIHEVHIINMLRTPVDIAKSMRSRGNKEKEKGQFEALAGNYQKAMFSHATKWRHKLGGYVEVFFNGLINRPDDTLEYISHKIGRTLKNNGFIDSSISRNTDGHTVRTAEEVGQSIQSRGQQLSV